jgi:uncharacterized membrane protein
VAAAPAPVVVAQTQGGLSDTAAGAIAYLTFIPAVIFLVMEPYNRNKFVRFHAFQCIALTVVSVAAHIAVNFLPLIGLVISFALSLIFFVAWLICILKASKGEMYKLPVIGDFAEKQANS